MPPIRQTVVLLLAGALLPVAGFWAGGWAVVDQSEWLDLQERIELLEEENRFLTEELFTVAGATQSVFDEVDPPYDETADAGDEIALARARAVDSQKFLMVTFGANWCVDCRTLYKHLGDEEVESYTSDRFEFVNVDVGKFNRNLDVAAELGVTLERGIPVAVVFDPSGQLIGTTNNGELEPSRHYSSRQILKFVRNIAEQSRIVAPNSVE